MRIEPLTDEAFAAFGTLIRHPGGPPRHPVPSLMETPLLDGKPAAWTSRLEQAAWPHRIEKLERHPHGAQSFLPLGRGTPLVVACGAGADGMPDPALMRAFLCPPDTGFTYRTGTWHHGLTGVGAAMDVLVLMAAHGVAGDTDWFNLPSVITLEERDLP